ncbi:MAG: ATP-dependent Clp protease proteolytic subunit [Patescibacteria group bacterium]
MPEYPVPYISEQTPRGERISDIFSRLLSERIIFLMGPISDTLANIVIAQLLLLQQQDSKKEIKMYINSPGGSAYAAFAIYDTMQQLSNPISTIAVGMAASAATMILAAGTPGKRAALEHTLVHMHQPLGEAGGQASDIEITAREILRLKDLYAQTLAKHAGKTTQSVTNDIDRDVNMTPEEAKKYGLIDKIIK